MQPGFSFYPVALCISTAFATAACAAQSSSTVRLLTLDPGHFHAGLVQKSPYPQVSPVVRVYAPAGQDLEEHLKRIESYNTRAEDPTGWEEKVYRGPDFLKRMVNEKAGNVVVISGNNLRKSEYIDESIKAGFNVLADKPMAISPAGFKMLRKSFERSAKNGVLLYDIMTERFEVTSAVERELARTPDLFGVLQTGSLEHPAVEMTSIHHFFKEVSGKPLLRPAWFYDGSQQGEALTDVATHVVDLVQWECFPDQVLDWQKDIKMLAARRWPTRITPEQFKRSTGLDQYPGFLRKEVGSDGVLNVYQNGEATYTLRGVHAKVSILWNYEAPPGAKDSHYSLLRGTKASLSIKQRAEENYVTTLYVENTANVPEDQFERTLRAAVGRLGATWPGLDVKKAGDSWTVVIPEKYRLGHEAHFGQVTANFLRFLAAGQLPAWEVPNMLAKYYTTTAAYRLSLKAPASEP